MSDFDKYLVRLPPKEAKLDGDTTIYLFGGRRLIHDLKEFKVDVPATVEKFLKDLLDELKKGGIKNE